MLYDFFLLLYIYHIYHKWFPLLLDYVMYLNKCIVWNEMIFQKKIHFCILYS